MHSTVRFAELPHQGNRSGRGSGGSGLQFRLPKISAASQPDAGSYSAYNRHGYSPPSPQAEAAGYWKYPLPSKSFRLYVGPSLREPQPATAGYSHSASRGQAENADVGPGQLQRSRTDPGIGLRRSQQQQQQQPAPYLPSRAQIFLRRQPPGLYREATALPGGVPSAKQEDEAERLRWTMSTQRHWQADRKGQQRNQGPFSREFTVHVTAPSCWMRMKWGRKQPAQMPDSGRAPLLDTASPQQLQQPQQFSYMYTKQAFGHHHGSHEF